MGRLFEVPNAPACACSFLAERTVRLDGCDASKDLKRFVTDPLFSASSPPFEAIPSFLPRPVLGSRLLLALVLLVSIFDYPCCLRLGGIVSLPLVSHLGSLITVVVGSSSSVDAAVVQPCEDKSQFRAN